MSLFPYSTAIIKLKYDTSKWDSISIECGTQLSFSCCHLQKRGLINLPYKMNQQFSFITSSFLRLIKDKF